MSGGRRVPRPVRGEPVLPAGMTLAGYLIATVAVGVFGGGAVSGVIAGHGFGIVAPDQMSVTLVRLATRPGNPGAAWPGDPRPGSALLTWLCIGLATTLWCTTTGLARSEIDTRIRRRHRDGLAGSADLRHLGLDQRSAAHKAASEYPLLAQQQPRRHSFRPRRWRR